MRALAALGRSLIATALVLGGSLAVLVPGSAAHVPADLDPLFANGGIATSSAGGLYLPTQHNLLGDREGTPIGTYRRRRASPVCGYTIRLDRFAINDGSLTGSSELPVDAPCASPLPSETAIDQDGLGRFYLATGEGASIHLTRLLADGSVDSTFGESGAKAIATNLPVAPDLLHASPDGEVWVAGVAAQVPGGGATTMFLAKFGSDGNLDPSFRGGGLFFFDSGLGESTPEPGALEVGPDGEVYLAGPVSRSTAGHQWTPAGIRAFLPDGQPDPAFGHAGLVKLGGYDAPSMVLSRGQLLVSVNGEGRPARVLRLTRSGRLDPSFGADGTASLPARQGFRAAEMAVDPGGRIVLAGVSGCCDIQRPEEFAVRRLEPGGAIDRTFAGGGFFRLAQPRAASREEIDVEGLLVSSGNAGGGITVAGSIVGPCSPTCPGAPSTLVRFRLEGQQSHERCQGRRATIVGTSRGEKLVGTDQADTIVGLGGNDRIFGRGGNDRICGGEGKDVLRGGSGRNLVFQQ